MAGSIVKLTLSDARSNRGDALKPGEWLLNASRVKSAYQLGTDVVLKYQERSQGGVFKPIEYVLDTETLATEVAKLSVKRGNRLLIPTLTKKNTLKWENIQVDDITIGYEDLNGRANLEIEDGGFKPKRYVLNADIDAVVAVTDDNYSDTTDNDITAFGVIIDGEVVAAEEGEITAGTTRTVTYEVPAGTDLESLVPVFTLSPFATARVGTTPIISGVTALDFSSAVTLSILAYDQSTANDWTITITEESS